MRVDGVSTGVWAALNDDTPSYSTNTFHYPYSSPIAIRDTRSYTIQSTCPARVITQCSIATTSLTSQDKTIYRLQILGSEIFQVDRLSSIALSPKREGAPRLTLTNIFRHSVIGSRSGRPIKRMLLFARAFSSIKMAQAPRKPLITIVGATGTGKSDVKLIRLVMLHLADHIR